MIGAATIGVAAIILALALRANANGTEPGMEEVLDAIRARIDDEEERKRSAGR